MKMVNKYTMLALAVAGIALMPARANAATLTLNDGLDVWTLSVQENCSTCAVSLSVVYDPNSARIGTTLQATSLPLWIEFRPQRRSVTFRLRLITSIRSRTHWAVLLRRASTIPTAA